MLRSFIMKPLDVRITPYVPEFYKHIKNLIEDNDMECNTGVLPEFGIVAFAKESDKPAKIVGYIGAHRKYGDSGHIDIFVVDSRFRNHDIGCNILEELLSMLQTCGIRKFSATVDHDNDNAISLYKSLAAPLEPKLEIEDRVGRALTAVKDRLDNP